jgi:hypothetical protein
MGAEQVGPAARDQPKQFRVPENWNAAVGRHMALFAHDRQSRIQVRTAALDRQPRRICRAVSGEPRRLLRTTALTELARGVLCLLRRVRRPKRGNPWQVFGIGNWASPRPATASCHGGLAKRATSTQGYARAVHEIWIIDVTHFWLSDHASCCPQTTSSR